MVKAMPNIFAIGESIAQLILMLAGDKVKTIAHAEQEVSRLFDFAALPFGNHTLLH